MCKVFGTDSPAQGHGYVCVRSGRDAVLDVREERAARKAQGEARIAKVQLGGRGEMKKRNKLTIRGKSDRDCDDLFEVVTVYVNNENVGSLVVDRGHAKEIVRRLGDGNPIRT